MTMSDTEPDTDIINTSGLEMGPSKRGEAIERWMAAEYHMVLDDNTHFDAYLGDRPVQVKGAQRRIKNGRDGQRQKYTSGRFRLYEMDHEWLLEHDGLYAFCVYDEEDGDLHVMRTAIMSASEVHKVLDDNPWYSLDSLERKTEGSATRVRWTRLLRGDD